jgi:hypothetical protein
VKFTSAGMALSICAFHLSAATVTISQRGIQALDSTQHTHSASIISATPTKAGVEYSISFTTDQSSLELVSSINSGNGSFVGLPWASGNGLALQFTLLSEPPGRAAYVSAGSLINGKQSSGGYKPVRLGGAYPPSRISVTESDATVIKKIGFAVYIEPDNASAWPRYGGTIRLRVEAAPDTTAIDAPAGSTDRDRLNAATMSFSPSTILAFHQMPSPNPSVQIARIEDAVARDGGVEYTIAFPARGIPALLLELSSIRTGPASPFPESVEHIALRFTLLSSTLGQGACLAATLGANDIRAGGDSVEVGCEGTGSTGVVNFDIDAGATRSVILSIGPGFGAHERLKGQTARVLVEPAPGALVSDLVQARE